MKSLSSNFRRTRVKKKATKGLTTLLTITTILWSIGAYVAFLLPDKGLEAGFNPIVISEIKPMDPEPFIELYVRETENFNLENQMYLQYCTANCDQAASWEANQVQLPDAQVSGNSFYLIGTDGMTPCLT